jgi:hypothetical protein
MENNLASDLAAEVPSIMDISKNILDMKAAEAMATNVDVLLCCFLLLFALFIAYLTKKYQFIYLPESGRAQISTSFCPAHVSCTFC